MLASFLISWLVGCLVGWLAGFSGGLEGKTACSFLIIWLFASFLVLLFNRLAMTGTSAVGGKVWKRGKSHGCLGASSAWA